MSKSNQRIALITGASRGLGWAAAHALAEAGVHVILLGRTQGALEELYDIITKSGGDATGVPLDLSDYDAIDRLGAMIFERWGRLDILIGNAGMLGAITPAAHIDPQELEKAFAVNFFANARLIRAMESLLLQSSAPRVLFTSSGVAAWAAGAREQKPPRAFWGIYASSKAALNALVLCWAAEHLHDKLRINLLSPGPFRTAMRAQAMPGEDPDTLPPPSEIAPLFVELTRPDHTKTGEIISFSRR